MTKWIKLVEREGDFLKNCLLYESLPYFFSIFGIHHPAILTVRKGHTFIHYLDTVEQQEAITFLQHQSPEYIAAFIETGKKRFKELLEFCRHVPTTSQNPLELANLLENYFNFYKKSYPYFTMSIFAAGLAKEQMETLADWRLYSRKSFNQAHELIEPIFLQAAKILNLTLEEFKFLQPQEILAALRLSEKIKPRYHCYFEFSQGKYQLKENEQRQVEHAHIKGHGTFPGKYRGKVRVIKKNDDLKQVRKGEILVTRMTTPDLLLDAFRNAGAIVTDEGGITCHAAVLSREFGIPALMGTGNATQILKTGDEVEVDTEKGTLQKMN